MEEERIPATEIYNNQYSHFGRLNDLLYKLPLLYSTLIGGLWYFATSMKASDPALSIFIFLFSACVCSYCSHANSRFRKAFSLYLDNINKFDREYKITIGKTTGDSSITTLEAFHRMLRVAFWLSIAGGLYMAKPYILAVIKAICVDMNGAG